MFRVIGGAVVYGLALYGVVKLFERPTMEGVIASDDTQGARKRSEGAADGPVSQGGEPADDQTSQASGRESAPAHSA